MVRSVDMTVMVRSVDMAEVVHSVESTLIQFTPLLVILSAALVILSAALVILSAALVILSEVEGPPEQGTHSLSLCQLDEIPPLRSG